MSKRTNLQVEPGEKTFSIQCWDLSMQSVKPEWVFTILP